MVTTQVFHILVTYSYKMNTWIVPTKQNENVKILEYKN